MKEKRKINLRTIIFILIILIIVFLLWARYINTKGLVVREYGITNKELPTSFHGLKIVQFSDIHYGQTTDLDDIKNIVKQINNLKPDIVFFTGDLFNNNNSLSDKELKNITKELSKIETALYKYAISGDQDLKDYNNYQTIMQEANFILLNNSNEHLYYESEIPVKIVGLTNTEDLENAFKEESATESFTITLMHQPDQIDSLNDYRVDIAFAGHSLGGLIRLPFLEGIIKKDGSQKYISDYYKVNNTDIYVSSGIGTDNIKFRVFNKPSINLYRIYNK